MHLLAVSTSHRTAFHVSTSDHSINELPLTSSVYDGLRPRKAAISTAASSRPIFSGYSRAYDCLITAGCSPARVTFFRNFSQTLKSNAKSNILADQWRDWNDIQFEPEKGTERRKRLKNERKKKAKLGQTESLTIELIAREDVCDFHLHPAEEHMFVLGSQGGMSVYNVKTCDLLVHWELLHYGSVSSISVSCLRNRVLTADGENMRVWNTKDLIPRTKGELIRPEAIRSFRFDKDRILRICFLPFTNDRAILATLKGGVRCVELLHGSTLFEKQFSTPIKHISFSPCLDYIIISNSSAQIHAMHIATMINGDTSCQSCHQRTEAVELPSDIKSGAPQPTDIFFAIAKGQYMPVEKKANSASTPPTRFQLLTDRFDDFSTDTPFVPFTDHLQGKYFIVDLSGAFREWDINEFTMTSVFRGSDKKLRSSFSNGHFFKYPIDFVCLLRDSETSSESFSCAPSAESTVTSSLARAPPTKKPNSAHDDSPVTDTLGPSDMVPFDVPENYDAILESRLHLQNIAQRLRDEIFELEKAAREIERIREPCET